MAESGIDLDYDLKELDIIDLELLGFEDFEDNKTFHIPQCYELKSKTLPERKQRREQRQRLRATGGGGARRAVGGGSGGGRAGPSGAARPRSAHPARPASTLGAARHAVLKLKCIIVLRRNM
ncbi:Protein of unknown function [Gryllus bimaculatus]|nr:Protein of unknown function [Gryllus bimaculatus]